MDWSIGALFVTQETGDARTSSDMMTKQVRKANLPPLTVKFVLIYAVGCAYSNIINVKTNQGSVAVILSFSNDVQKCYYSFGSN